MQYFIALVHKDKDSAYGVQFPDLPGCFSAADELADVVPNATEALALWFEDVESVRPRTLDDIRAEVAEELSGGAFLVAVPLIRPEAVQVRANISLDRGILSAIDAVAKERGLTRSGFLTEAARNEIEGRH